MGILLALTAALAYGLSDFLGGIVSRRTTAWPVALTAGLGGLLGAVVLAAFVDGDPTRSDLLWGALSGVGSGAGGAFLYRGFATGRMGVVAPVSAVGAAVLPVVVGVATGERPGVVVWLGILAAMPGIWLVARTPDEVGTAGGTVDAALVDGLLAGLGFGVLFVALGQVPDEAGYLPLVAGQLTSLVAIAVLASLFGAVWLPRVASQWWGVAAGLLASAAVLCFLLATQRGLLTVAAVLTSLYPAFTVLLAATALRERIHAAQAVGLVLCGVAVGLVAGG
ncbi:MAG TPA: DMT family transporter [Nocardioides sp.]|nr:DMT family transporter [Nocardioides sp.]